MPTEMMKCGHSVNAQTQDNKPCCAICMGLTPDAKIVVSAPDLTGRKAKCPDCRTIKDSHIGLAFFEHRPGKEFDSYYCGCMGWN